MLNLNLFRKKALGLPDLLTYAACVDEGVFLNKDGSLMSAFTFAGPDLRALGADETNALTAAVNAAVMRLDEGWMLHCDASRVPTRSYPDCEFPDPVTALMDVGRRLGHEQEGAHFETRFTMTVTWLPPLDAQARLARRFVHGADEAAATGSIAGLGARTLERFRDAFAEFAGAFSAGGRVAVRVLGSNELYAHLAACVSGEAWPLRLPEVPMYLDCLVGQHEFVGGFNPRVGRKHLSVVSLTEFPASSFPTALELLANYPGEYRWSTRWIPLAPSDAERLIQGYRRDWGKGREGLASTMLRRDSFENTAATSLVLDADAALNRVRDKQIGAGFYTSVVVLYDEDPVRLRHTVADLRKRIGNQLGFASHEEGMNAVEAYLGSLPGHAMPNVRRPVLSTENLADFLPLTGVWSGFEHNPCEFYPPASPPLLFARTEGATPFRLSLHAGPTGHTMVLGPSGTGKSVLLGLIAASQFRYPDAKVFAFDKGYSMYVLCKAAGGRHYDIGGEHQALSFYPFAHIDESAAELAWAAEYAETLALTQGVTVSAAQRAEIFEALRLLAQAPADARTMTDFVSMLQDDELRTAIGAYCLGRGAAGNMLDSKVDHLEHGRFQVFELEHLMNLGEKQVVPVLMYLFHALERQFDGTPTLLVLDEAWLMLSHPYFRERIREWLKVLRKRNVAVVFATQSVADIVKSPIADTLIEQCPTRILLANPDAQSEVSRGAYEKLSLNTAQIDLLGRHMVPKKHYLVLTPAGRRVIDLGIQPLQLAFIGVSGADEVRMAREFEQRHGAQWVSHWLRERGCEGWAPFYEWLAAQPRYTNAPRPSNED